MTEVLLIGGRSGAGKSSVGWEVSVLLRAAAVAHAVIEGDFMGQVHPAPPGDPDRLGITERNLAAIWSNYAALGYRRLVYTNTASVLPGSVAMVTRAMGPAVRAVPVLLTASDATAGARLADRERGSELAASLARSTEMARMLDEQAPDALRVATDGRSVAEVAAAVVAATGWCAA